MDIYYISLDKEKTLNAYEWQEDENNYENGSRELHIFPAMLRASERGLSADDPYHVAIQLIQAGCSYGPDFNEAKISEFSLNDLFDESLNSDFQSLDFNYSAVRSEARTHFAEEHIRKMGLKEDAYDEALREFVEEIEENCTNKEWEHYEAIDAIEDEWVENAASWNRDTASSALRAELVDENLQITYKIVWE